MIVQHRVEAALIPFIALALAGVAVVVAPAGQNPEGQPGSSSGGGFQYVTTDAVRARDEAEVRSQAATKEQDQAVKDRADRKKELDAAIASGLSGPKVSPDQLNQRRERYNAATRVLTEKTLAATEAQKELRRRERDLQALAPAPGTPPSSVPALNPLTSLNPQLGPTYVYVAELNQLLSDARRLPPPLLGDPRFAAEPIEVQLQNIQDKYESGPRTDDAGIAKYPKEVPPIINAGPVTLAGTQWSQYHFNPGGELTVDTRGWPQWGAGSWSQTGNKVVMKWRTKGSFDWYWHEYTVNAQITEDTMTGTCEWTVHTSDRERRPTTRRYTYTFSAKRTEN